MKNLNFFLINTIIFSFTKKRTLSLVSTFIYAKNEVPGFEPTLNLHVYNWMKLSHSITGKFFKSNVMLLPKLLPDNFVK